MRSPSEEAGLVSSFSYESVEKLAEACVDFYHKSLENADLSDARERRRQLARYVRKFHGECGTLTPCVEEVIRSLEDGSCLLLMTAHQPNLFAYGGVLRKATLNHVLAERLRKSLRVPVVSFFGVADQDFTDDRWVRSALLPDVERRNGLLELRFEMPEKLMLNRVAKPSRMVLDGWRGEIKNWVDKKLGSIERECRTFKLQLGKKKGELAWNFEGFWGLVEDAYERAQTYADFNAFVMSRIVNDVWGYGTLFSRFSECQRIFECEFCFLLSRFDEYSRYVKEATACALEGGVHDQECETIPFWYHCDCGSKARLRAEQMGVCPTGHGQCLRCGREYQFDFQSENEPRISEIVSLISARSLSMPLVFFQGLRVGCYVGGVGGQEYLEQARYVAERLGLSFSPVVVWRPRDVYCGVGQLDALTTFKRLSGTFDFSQYAMVEAGLKKRVAEVEEEVDSLESEKKNLMAGSVGGEEERVQRLKALSNRQNMVRRVAGFPLLVRNLKLLGNVAGVMRLCPCIVDYAVNVGLRETSEQWMTFLKGDGSLSSDVSLRTGFDDVLQCVRPEHGAVE
jgi:hypothetical protein